MPDTLGYGNAADPRRLLERVGLVYFDLKLYDPTQPQRYTGEDDGPILRNLQALARSNTPDVVRVPLVPGLTDRHETFQG